MDIAVYVVIFTAKIVDLDDQYAATAQRMRDLAFSKYGCKEFNVSTEGDTEIAVSYWSSLESIQEWKKESEQAEAQSLGKRKWYGGYKVDIARRA